MTNFRLKIGIISYRSNPHCGGQGVYVRNLSQALSDLGHYVEVISGPPDPLLTGNAKLTMLKTLDLYNPENLFRTPTPHELMDPFNLIEWLGVSTMGYPEPLTFGMRANKFLSNRLDQYDIIHDNQCLAYGILSLAERIPLTATIHHPMTVDRRIAVNSTRSFFKKVKHLRWYSFIGMQKYVAERISKIITVSEYSKKDIAKEFSIPEKNFTTIPNGIDTDLFHPLDNIKREKNRLIVTNSADTPLKGLYYLLHAVKKISEKRSIKLIVIGAPKKNGDIEKLIKSLYLDNIVQFTGRIDHLRFIKEYARASLAVIPSVYEGFGLPVGEAMACRIPVICTTGGALPEVAGDAAKMVPPADSNALEKAIKELLDDPDECERLADAGYKRVLKHFTWERTAIETARTYKRVINDYNRL
ncbi:MAG: glycosyltransferase family 4 protein [Thermodesulfobacteriota bacterium]|nr:glycosyltransferase family 4 protein [Thermodesulfobacteriota bacterium]